MFEDIAGQRHLAVDKIKHDFLTRNGETAIADNDIDELRRVIRALNKNLVKSAEPSRVSILSGLMT